MPSFKRVLGSVLLEVTHRQEDDPETASGAEEVELEFEDGNTLLIYIKNDRLVVEVD